MTIRQPKVLTKLLVVNTSTGWGGLEMNVVKLGVELMHRDIDIHFVCRQDSEFAKQIKRQFPNIMLLTNCRKYFDLSNAKKIATYARQHDIHVVFTAFRPDLDLLLWTKWRIPQLKIVHQQQMQIGLSKKGFFQRMRLGAVDRWLTPLQWLKDELLEKTTLDASKIQIVPLGVDTNRFVPESLPSKLSAREVFGMLSIGNTTTFWLGVIGRIDEKKGQLFVVHMIKHLIDRGENVALLIVGDPTIDDPKSKIYYQQIIDFIAEHKLTNYIRLVTSIKETTHFYAAINLFVMASQGETYGMVTIEAMLLETPVMGTKSGGTPELLQHGKYGTLYNVNDTKSFETAYYEIRKRIQEREINLSEIRMQVAKKYSLEQEIDGVLQAIKS